MTQLNDHRSPLPRSRRCPIALSLALVALTAGGSALAQPEAGVRISPEILNREAKKLLADGRVAEACARFAASYKMDHAGGTLLNLATCHEADGKTATAFDEFSEALTLARKDKRPDREKIAKARIAEIEPKLAHFIVSVPAQAAVSGLTVTVGGVEIAKDTWGKPIPIDPGEKTAAATAPKREPWEAKLTIRERESTTVVIPVLKEPPPPPRPPPVKAPAWRRPVGYAAIGVGVIGIGIGTYFGVRALSLGAQSNSGCTNGVCNADGYQAYKDGTTAATASDILFSVGIAAAGAGAFLLISTAIIESTPPPEKPTALRIQAAPLPGPGGIIAVGGAF